MKKIKAFFSISLKTAFVYKARGLIWFLIDVLPILTIMLFFSAVFSEKNLVGGYSLSSILVYYVVALSLNVLVISHPEHAIAEHISRGFLSFFLIKPLSYIKYYLANELAYKVLRLMNLIPVLIILLGVAPSLLRISDLDFWEWARFLLMVTLAFNVYSFFKFIIGFAAFWFTEIGWLIGAWDLLNLLFSGLLIPIDLMPPFFQKIAAVLPFKYLIYMPAQLFLGKSSANEQLVGLTIQSLWLIALVFLTKKIWRKGIRIYSAFGN